MITVTFACGHREPVEHPTSAPTCSQCGERRIARVETKAPIFRGAASGPLVQEN